MVEFSAFPQFAHISIARFNSQTCVYCGSIWDIHRDHVIPTCYLREKRRYEGDWLVPACAECNRTLGSELIFNVPDRAAYVTTCYEWKYRKLLRARQWDDDELEELGPNLLKMILGDRLERKEIEARMRHLRAVSGLPITYLARLRPHIDPRDEDIPEFLDDDIATARQRRRELKRRAQNLKRIAEAAV